eukprot:COSAG05_NODE_18125_length_313_cov_0.962617_1_plen_57_part_00
MGGVEAAEPEEGLTTRKQLIDGSRRRLGLHDILAVDPCEKMVRLRSELLARKSYSQ